MQRKRTQHYAVLSRTAKSCYPTFRRSEWFKNWRKDDPAIGRFLHHVPSQLSTEPEETQETEFCWIDAICMNQQKEKERIHQGAMMGDIYLRHRRDCCHLVDTAWPIEERTLQQNDWFNLKRNSCRDERRRGEGLWQTQRQSLGKVLRNRA